MFLQMLSARLIPVSIRDWMTANTFPKIKQKYKDLRYFPGMDSLIGNIMISLKQSFIYAASLFILQSL